MNFPEGDQTGRVSEATSFVIQLNCFDSRFTTRMSNLVRSIF